MITSTVMAIPLSAAEIADDVARRIGEGEFLPGEPLPTYRDLANFYKVGRTTISVAILILKDRELVESKPGRAVFVREDVGR